jgi:uncharacterized membrane protein
MAFANPLKPTMYKRSFGIDVLRGLAIVFMVVFHFGYDLTVFGYAHYDTNADIEWRIFRAIIVSSFLMAMGMSAYLAYRDGIKWQKLWQALVKLVSVSVLISLGSYLLYPNNWIYFGIIHFAAFALPACLLFIRQPQLASVLGVAIILGYFTDSLSLHLPWLWAVEHLHIPRHTVDLVSVIPWFGVVLLGLCCSHYQLIPQVKANGLTKGLGFLGQHSLLIYLIHQPILFAFFNGFVWLNR